MVNESCLDQKTRLHERGREQIWLLTGDAESELGWVLCEESGEQGGFSHSRWARQHQRSEEIRGDGRGGHCSVERDKKWQVTGV